MKRPSGPWTTWHLTNATVFAAAAVISACTSGSDDTKDQKAGTGATTSAADSARPAAAAAQGISRAPVLTAKIEDITPGDFVKVVEGVTWTGHIVERQCDEAGCSGAPGNTSTVVRHEAAAGANDLDVGALPENGVVVSRMQNLGTRKEKFYGLRGGKEYYVILTPGGTNAPANFQLVNLDFDGRGRPKLDLMPRKRPVNPCDSEHHTAADAGFKECRPPSTPAPPFALPTSFNRGAWFTCSLGCCTTGGVTIGADSAAADSARRQ